MIEFETVLIPAREDDARIEKVSKYRKLQDFFTEVQHGTDI
jgi:hypothetical protein